MVTIARPDRWISAAGTVDKSVYWNEYRLPQGATMSQTGRIRPETHAKLKSIAEDMGKPLSEVLDDAVEVLRRHRLLDATSDAFAALKKNPKAWKAELAEREAWDASLSDGLEDK